MGRDSIFSLIILIIHFLSNSLMKINQSRGELRKSLRKTGVQVRQTPQVWEDLASLLVFLRTLNLALISHPTHLLFLLWSH